MLLCEGIPSCHTQKAVTYTCLQYELALRLFYKKRESKINWGIHLKHFPACLRNIYLGEHQKVETRGLHCEPVPVVRAGASCLQERREAAGAGCDS